MFVEILQHDDIFKAELVLQELHAHQYNTKTSIMMQAGKMYVNLFIILLIY